MTDAADNTILDSYLRYLQTQRKLSAHTLDNYERDLSQLLALIQEQSKEQGTRTLTSVSPLEIRRFAALLHGRGLAPASIARKLSAWRGFFGWMAIHHGLAMNPVSDIRPPKRTKSLPKALGVDDAIRLVSARPTAEHDGHEEQEAPAEQDAARRAQRLCNQAMFELLYSSGLRVSELTSLDMRHAQTADHVSAGWLDLDAAEVTVTGKGNKRRTVPVGAAAIDAIRAWLAHRPSPSAAGSHAVGGADPHALFITARGRRMTPRAVQQRIKEHARALGVPADVHPHMLRHSFASHLLQSSGDLRAVQEMLGHASIASTQVYTSLDFQRLAQVYDAAHPRARKQRGDD